MLGRRMRSVQGWTAVLLRPGVVPILAAMREHAEFRSFAWIRQAAPGGSAAIAANVLRMLGSRDFVVRGGAVVGTWDEPNDATQFALTDRGHQFAAAVGSLSAFVARLPGR